MISVIVSAFNEEKTIVAAVQGVFSAASAAGRRVEVLLVDDGSTDGTPALADELAASNPDVRVIHHVTNIGIGASFLECVAAAKYDWITFFPGDSLVTVATLSRMLQNAGKADMICSYTVNTESRTRLRNFISSVFNFVYLNAFNLPLRYIHSTPIYPVERLRRSRFHCRRYSFPSEITIKLLRGGCTFMELPGYINQDSSPGKSSALRLKNLIEVVSSFLQLVYEVHFKHRAEYSHKPHRVIPENEGA